MAFDSMGTNLFHLSAAIYFLGDVFFYFNTDNSLLGVAVNIFVYDGRCWGEPTGVQDNIKLVSANCGIWRLIPGNGGMSDCWWGVAATLQLFHHAHESGASIYLEIAQNSALKKPYSPR